MQMKPTAPLSGGDAVRTASENGHHHSPGVYGPSGRSPWLDVDWREQQRWVSVDGQPVNTIDLGEGPPIVFVHGLAGSWPNWLEQLPMFTPGPPIVFVHGLAGSWPNWLEQLPMFTRDHRVIAMDLPGFGHSPMPRDEITISGYARLLDGLLDELGINAAAVVGNSMGGFVSAQNAIAIR